MIFGKTLKQKAINRSKIWFAWYPVILDGGQTVWLQKVKRKVEPFGDCTLLYSYYKLS